MVKFKRKNYWLLVKKRWDDIMEQANIKELRRYKEQIEIAKYTYPVFKKYIYQKLDQKLQANIVSAQIDLMDKFYFVLGGVAQRCILETCCKLIDEEFLENRLVLQLDCGKSVNTTPFDLREKLREEINRYKEEVEEVKLKHGHSWGKELKEVKTKKARPKKAGGFIKMQSHGIDGQPEKSEKGGKKI